MDLTMHTWTIRITTTTTPQRTMITIDICMAIMVEPMYTYICATNGTVRRITTSTTVNGTASIRTTVTDTTAVTTTAIQYASMAGPGPLPTAKQVAIIIKVPVVEIVALMSQI